MKPSPCARPSPLRSSLRSSLFAPVFALAAVFAAGCAAPPPAPPPTGLAEVMARPAERALLDGIRAYDDGQYAQAEKALHQALGDGLQSARDRATAHKLLAFISCTSQRLADCEQQFRDGVGHVRRGIGDQCDRPGRKCSGNGDQ